jgi:hypothetical protein
MARIRTTYQPTPGATEDQVLDFARRCGRDLNPNDHRARWIDALKGAAYTAAVEAYHAGQAERYECEDW